jgi:hypothetical protein
MANIWTGLTFLEYMAMMQLRLVSAFDHRCPNNVDAQKSMVSTWCFMVFGWSVFCFIKEVVTIYQTCSRDDFLVNFHFKGVGKKKADVKGV